jgi:ATP-dependent Clp protease ATP-binding subunit ClpB
MVVFHPLDREQIREIAAIQLDRLRKRLEGHGFGLVVTDAALDRLGEAGFDPVYGARPLKRAIQNELENPLAQKILSGGYASGDTIQVDVADGRFVFD